jgi:hypothetical protein
MEAGRTLGGPCWALGSGPSSLPAVLHVNALL